MLLINLLHTYYLPVMSILKITKLNMYIVWCHYHSIQTYFQNYINYEIVVYDLKQCSNLCWSWYSFNILMPYFTEISPGANIMPVSNQRWVKRNLKLIIVFWQELTFFFDLSDKWTTSKLNPLAAMADQFPCAEPIYCNLILN